MKDGKWRGVAKEGSRVGVKLSWGEGVGGSILGMSAFFTKNQVLAVLSSQLSQFSQFKPFINYFIRT